MGGEENHSRSSVKCTDQTDFTMTMGEWLDLIMESDSPVSCKVSKKKYLMSRQDHITCR